MSVIEGYSDFVMHNVGKGLVPHYEDLKERMARSRSHRPPFETAVFRLTGLDVKLEQYRLGEQFADAVVKRQGMEGLNRVWEGPENLPTPGRGARPRPLDVEDGDAELENEPAATLPFLGLRVRPRRGGQNRRRRPRPALHGERALRPAHLPRPLERQLHGRGDVLRRHPASPPRRRPRPPRRVRRPRTPRRPHGLQAGHARGQQALPDWLRRFFGS